MEIQAQYAQVEGLRVYQVVPEQPTGGGMLLLPMITGIGEQVREFAQNIAHQTGVVALAWDPFHGKSTDNSTIEERRELLSNMQDDDSIAEQHFLLQHMRTSMGVQRVGVVGWCLGGRFALLLGAQDANLANVIAFHPTVRLEHSANQTLNTFEHIPNIAAPVFLAYPGQDTIVPWESFQRMSQALSKRTTAPSIVQLYPQAHHGFSDTKNHDAPKNLEAFNLAWPQAMQLIATTTKTV